MIIETTKYLMDLYLTGNFYEILVLAPSFQNLDLPIPARLILSLVLLQLGRVQTGIRELAISIELASDEKERHLLSEYLLKAQQQSYSSQIRAPPIHKQADMFLIANGILETYSLGRICIITNNLCCDVLKSIITKDEVGLLNKFVQSVKHFSPLYVYREVSQKREMFESYMNKEISKYPEIEYSNCSSSTMLEMISRVTRRSPSKVFSLAISGLVVKHQIVRGFLCYVCEEYHKAFEIFEWLEIYFIGSEEILMDRNEFLSNVTRRQVVLLLICSYLMIVDKKEEQLLESKLCYPAYHWRRSKKCEKSDTAENLLVSITSVGKDMNRISELLSGRLCLYFICAGGLYEKLAFKRATSVKINTNILALRLNQDEIKEMLRKYIIATTITAHDDPSVIDLYQRILWGLLMYGGIHLQAFWFFKFLRDYFFKELSIGPIMFDKSGTFYPFGEKDILTKYPNSHECVEKIYHLRKTMIEDSCAVDNDITPLHHSDSHQYLIPQVFVYNNQLIYSNEFYDEMVPYCSQRDFISISNNDVRPKIRDQQKLNGEIVSKCIKVSAGFMRLWLNSFEIYRGIIPEEIIEFWEESRMEKVDFEDFEEENL
ncbi:hypothetical protein CLIB1423_01S06172 [[Candida] railenensis]|uniref:Uncharacterized protein n=1 Tax=[Candida] railenensis TaxID=45579 RepID=A0A9P0VWB0_9ASCO|nr:hypothetical protein CLIB1423_01S06172 [[Candida] railenensis]